MNASEQIEKLIASEAAEWIEKLARGDGRDMTAFAQWSRKSPQHMRQFLMMMALDHELTRIDPQKRIAVPSAADAAEVVPLGVPRPTATARSHRSRRWVMAAALASIAMGAALYLGLNRGGWQDFSTAQGEQRAIELDDGSIMHLNTLTRARVHFSASGRDIRLLRGEALFKVAKNAARPFRVHTDDAVIQAVGTQFNVYAKPDGTTVSVLEGRVRVSSHTPDTAAEPAAPASLDPGEEIRVDARGLVRSSRAAEVASMAAWRQRRLVFDQNPLSEVVTEFNRYNRAPQFRIMNEDIAVRPYSGAFDADDPESLLELLRVDPELRLEKDKDEVLIRKRY
jgi:transmembrane sensor